jgi:glycosyltransferase involved in cell wall biosynthesis
LKSVCFVVQSVYDFDQRVRRKAEALVAAGYSVDALALRASPHGQGSGKSSYSLNGVNVHTVSLSNWGFPGRFFFGYPVFFLWVFVRVTLQMLGRRYALIDVNSLPDFLIFAPLLAKWMGAKLVLDVHELTPEYYTSIYGLAEYSWRARALKFLAKLSFDFADYVITANEPREDLLIQRGLPRSKSTVIMNSVDEGKFSCSSPSTPPWPRNPQKFVMMYHGTVHYIYGLDIAIEAFAFVHTEMPGAELWIVGPGREKGRLTDLAQKRGLSSKVGVHEQIPAAQIPTWVSQCDIGIIPIRRDVFLDLAAPNKLSEYIVMGKAVIVSRLKAIRHYFSEEALAYFEPDNPDDLAKQMVRVYRDSGLRARLAARAKEEYAPICWDVMKQRYLRLIDNLIGTAG